MRGWNCFGPGLFSKKKGRSCVFWAGPMGRSPVRFLSGLAAALSRHARNLRAGLLCGFPGLAAALSRHARIFPRGGRRPRRIATAKGKLPQRGASPPDFPCVFADAASSRHGRRTQRQDRPRLAARLRRLRRGMSGFWGGYHIGSEPKAATAVPPPWPRRRRKRRGGVVTPPERRAEGGEAGCRRVGGEAARKRLTAREKPNTRPRRMRKTRRPRRGGTQGAHWSGSTSDRNSRPQAAREDGGQDAREPPGRTE
jgi:hypothetical protein